VREKRKAARLLRLLAALPRIRRGVSRHLAGAELTREFALAAVIELVATSAIRPGNEEYARAHGTRGATTLLKSNVKVAGHEIILSFRSNGGKRLEKTFDAPRLAPTIARLRTLPGPRLFQYRDGAGLVRPINSRETNDFLRLLAGVQISLKDLRTLCASALVVDSLARASPAPSERQRKRQVVEAIRQAADDLDNTPAICRKSYVHAAVVTAFEGGALERLSSSLNGSRGSARREKLLARVIANFAR
jgi:DNA topoisomerase-1